MPGPAPKAPQQRRRRNIPPQQTKTVLPAVYDPKELPAKIVDIKIIPRVDGKPWSDMVLAVWDELWHSPLVTQLTVLDAHLIMPLMYMIQHYFDMEPFLYRKEEVMHEDGSTEFLFTVDTVVVNSQRLQATEMRQWMDRYGLNPTSLHTLEWIIAEKEMVEDANARKRRNVPPTPMSKPGS